MANRIFDLPQTRGVFEIAGKVTGAQRNNFYNDATTKTGKQRRVLSFGIQANKTGAPFYVELSGMPRDKVYFLRREDKAKGIEKDKLEVSWKDRLTYAVPEGYEMMGVRVGVVKKQNDAGKMVNDNHVMTDFDAAKEIADNLHDGDSVYVRGNIEYSTYKGKHQVRFVPNQVSLCSKEVDFDAEDFKEIARFTQTIVYVDSRKADDSDEMVINAKIVNYNTIEDAEFFVNPNASKEHAQLVKSIRKFIKPYTAFECFGPIVNQEKIDEVEEENIWGGTNDMKRQVSPVTRKLYLKGINGDSFDPALNDRDATPTYTEDAIVEALAKIAANEQAKKDYNGKAGEKEAGDWWGGVNDGAKIDASDDSEPIWD